MGITNLAGTTWRFGEYLVSDYETAFEYNIETTYNVVCNSPYTNTFDKFSNFVDGANYRCLCTQFTGSTRSSIYYGYRSAPQIISNRRDGFEYTEVTFGEGADATNANLIAWLEANGTLVEEEPAATTITYNGETIATLEAGQTATIKAVEYEFDHDIVFKAGSGGAAPILQEKTATESGVYFPDRGYDGFSKFTVDVPSGGGGGITTSANSKKSEMRYVSTQMGAITTTATVSVA